MNEKATFIILFMVGVAAVFGTGITAVHMATQNTVIRNEQLLDQKARVQVFDLGEPRQLSQDEIARLVEERIDGKTRIRDPETGWESELLKAYADGSRTQLKAYGFRFRGLGLWGPIEGILAVTPDLRETVGIVILRQSETPGLGGRITEPVFTDQFAAGISVVPSKGSDRGLVFGQAKPDPGSPYADQHVDSITGATQTSIALERILNEHLVRFRRAMENHES